MAMALATASARKTFPQRSEQAGTTKMLVSRPVRDVGSNTAVAKPLAVEVVAPHAIEREAAQRSVYSMQDDGGASWGDVLAATLQVLGPGDNVRLVFLDDAGAQTLLAQDVGFLDDAWLPHSVVLFGDKKPVQLWQKKLPFIAWMLRGDFLKTRASYLEEDADTRLSPPSSSTSVRRAWPHPHEVDHDTFLDFLDYVLDQDAELNERFQNVLLFSSVPLPAVEQQDGAFVC